VSYDSPWILHFNIGGFCSSRTSLEIFLDEYGDSIPVVCLNEHWLRDTNSHLLNSMPGYICADFYCRESIDRGGSAIILKEGIKYRTRNELKVFCKDKVFEASFVETFNPNSIFISVYRIPAYEFEREFLDILHRLLYLIKRESRTKRIYFAADFNFDLLSTSTNSRELITIFESFGFRAEFCEPTRVVRSSATCIDNIFTNCLFNDGNSGIVLEMGVSDHYALLLSMADNKQHTHDSSKGFSKRRIRVFSATKIAEFKEKLSLVTWTFCNKASLDANYNVFLEQFSNYFNNIFTFKQSRAPKRAATGWVTNGIRTSSRNKRELHRIYKTTNDPNFILYYKRYNKIFKNTIKLAKNLANDRFIAKSNNRVKAAWKVVKSDLGHISSKADILPELNENSSLYSSQEICNKFNNFFINTFKEGNCSKNLMLALQSVPEDIANSFKFTKINPTIIKNIIVSLNNTRSTGWDNITVPVVKSVADIISFPLSKIINQSFESGSFPHKLKFSVVRPIYKKGSKNLLSNYRPISVLSVFSKIFEKVVNIQLLDYLNKLDILSKSQYGFIKGLNTEFAIAKFVDKILTAIDKQENPCGLFCDLSKAFDSVDHCILLRKLDKYGVSGTELKWFESYLTERMQKTRIFSNNLVYESEWEKVIAGVPQGSILGPTLFVIFVNDLSRYYDRFLIQYADDTSAVITGRNSDAITQQIPREIAQLRNWFHNNGLTMNAKKTNFISFRTTRSTQGNVSLSVDGIVIEDCDDVRFLGLTLDRHLKWEAHIEKITKKLNSACFSLRALKSLVSHEVLMMVYYAYFHPFLKYAVLAWGGSSCTDSVFKLQKYAIRIMCNKPPYYPCKELFKREKILTFPCLYILELVCYTKKYISSFRQCNDYHNYNTRHGSRLASTIHRTTLFENSPNYKGPKLYNHLPKYLRDMTSLSKFRGKLKKMLLDEAFYSVEEYFSKKID
jgi:hypothetical protein